MSHILGGQLLGYKKKQGSSISYFEQVLSMNPIAYWPMNETSGTTALDATGNGRIGTYKEAGTTLGQVGLVGAAVQLEDVDAAYAITPSAGLLAAIDPTEYAVAMLIKPTGMPTTGGIKMFEGWNAAGDYSAFECPTTGPLSVLLKEGGVTQSLTNLSGLVNDEWKLLICFNSESTGNSGYYVNKEFIPGPRLLAGIEPPFTAAASGVMANMTGFVQHMFWLNRVPTQAEVNALYNKAFSPDPWSLAYDFDDEFTTDDDAPMTSPRTAEPGPGTFNLTDVGNYVSISGGELIWANKTTNNVDPRIVSDSAFSHAVGRTFVASCTPGGLYIGLDTVATGSPDNHSFLFNSSVLYVNTGGGQLSMGAIVTNGTVTYKVAICQRRSGCLYFIKGGVYTNWTLIHVGRFGAAAEYFGAGCNAIAQVTKVQYMRTDILGSPFNEDYGLADTRLAGKRSALDVFTHSADCILDFIIYVLPSEGVIDLRFRQQDATNYWQLSFAADGSASLNEVVDDTPTARGTIAAGTIVAAERIVVRMNDERIQVIDTHASGEVSRIIYTSAANFKTETAGVLTGLGTGGVVTDLVVWPSIVPAEAAATLDAV